ncbi:ABC transporter substrate-binding protein [Niveibacterium sp. SC-1]|uniref:ABC transporter substrate-binding protein n=1 Tax=Niveibacterium sp. SC-1 TaxID=3135646 RepID=UPI0031201AD5
MHFKQSLIAGLIGLASLSAHAADKLVVQLDWLPDGDKAAAYVGVKQGFYAAENLEVTIQPGRGSSDAITKVATGAADIATGGISALMMAAAEGGIPVKAVMSVYSKQPDALFTVKGGPITSFKSVVGKTIALPPFSSSAAIWPVVLEANNIDPKSVTLLKVDPAAMAPMLAAGKVDATINWTTVAPNFEGVLKQAGKELAVLPWSAFGLDGYGLSVFASDKLIAQRPDVLKRFLRAYKKATEFAVKNPEAAAADLKSMVPEADVTAAAAAFRASVPLIQNEISAKDGLGSFEPKLLAKTWSWVAKSKDYPMDKIDPEKLVDRSFLPK